MLAGPFLIIGIFWLGWTGSESRSVHIPPLTNAHARRCPPDYSSINWAVPAVSLIFIGMSFTLVFISFLTYLGASPSACVSGQSDGRGR